MLEKDFVETMPDEPFETLQIVCLKVADSVNDIDLDDLDTCMDSKGMENLHDELLECMALSIVVIEKYNIEKYIGSETPILSGNTRGNIRSVAQYFSDFKMEVDQIVVNRKFSDKVSEFKLHLDIEFSYEFSGDELTRIQVLLNELRDEITKSELFEDKHKSRLLRRFEKLQSELHKKVSDLDRLWGLIGDAGVMLSKFGSDAKPFVDRIREIAEIVWKAQAKAEQLPVPKRMPLLTGGEGTKD